MMNRVQSITSIVCMTGILGINSKLSMCKMQHCMTLCGFLIYASVSDVPGTTDVKNEDKGQNKKHPKVQ